MTVDKDKMVMNLVRTLVNTMPDEEEFERVVIMIREDRHIGDDMKKEVFARFYDLVSRAIKNAAPKGDI